MFKMGLTSPLPCSTHPASPLGLRLYLDFTHIIELHFIAYFILRREDFDKKWRQLLGPESDPSLQQARLWGQSYNQEKRYSSNNLNKLKSENFPRYFPGENIPQVKIQPSGHLDFRLITP